MKYEHYTDEELIHAIQSGQQDATEYLLKKYSPLVKKSTRTLYLIGADTEDLAQEGMIGLFKAIQNYESHNDTSFYTFAKVCIDRQIYSAIKASNRKKHSPLNTYVSLYSKNGETESELIDNLEADHNSNPEHIIFDRENALHIEELLDTNLSKFERSILPLYLEGKSYTDIAAQLDRDSKSIDNAVQRIRGKMKKLYQT